MTSRFKQTTKSDTIAITKYKQERDYGPKREPA